MIGAILSGVAGLTQLGLGISDRIKGAKKLKESQSFYEQNKYDIPEAVKASLSSAERGVNMRLPGEDIARTRLAETTATGIGAAQQAGTSSSDVLSMLSSFIGNQNIGEQNLAMEAANRYDRSQDVLRNELGQMARYEDQKWQYNVLNPYLQMLGQAQAYSERGGQGIGMGLTALGQTAGMYDTWKNEEAMYEDWKKQKLGSADPVFRPSPFGEGVAVERMTPRTDRFFNWGSPNNNTNIDNIKIG